MKSVFIIAAPVFSLLVVACAGHASSVLPDTKVAPLQIQQALPAADLSVQMSADTSSTRVGQSVTYTIVATNDGPSASTLDTHVIPSRKLFPVVIQCAFGVSSDGPFCEPGIAQAHGQFTTTVIVDVLQPGNDAMTACVLSEGDTSDPNQRNNCATLRIAAKP